MEDSPVVPEPNTAALTAWAAGLLARCAAEPVRPTRRRADDAPETTLALAEMVRTGVTDAVTARFPEPDRQRVLDLLLSGHERTWPLVDGTFPADLPAAVRDRTAGIEALPGDDRHAFAVQVSVAILERLRRAATADAHAMSELWRDFTAEARLAEDHPPHRSADGGEPQYSNAFHGSVDTVVQAGLITEYHYHVSGESDPRHVSPSDESGPGEPRRLNRRVLLICASIIVAVTAAVVTVILLPGDDDSRSPSGEQVDATGSEDADPSSSDSDPEDIASDFVGSYPEEAQPLQCTDYAGPDRYEVSQAIEDWATQHGEGYSFISRILPAAEAGSDDATVFDVELTLQGDDYRETFTFVVAVEGDCIASMEGGEGLISSD